MTWIIKFGFKTFQCNCTFIYNKWWMVQKGQLQLVELNSIWKLSAKLCCLEQLMNGTKESISFDNIETATIN